jgi:dTDP-4-amino-4,6-dideoxygalactose transaminase
MNVPFLDLSWQSKQIAGSLAPRWQAILDKTAYINGPDVKAFEENFARYLGVKHAIGVANGTDALILTMKALGIGPGDEAIAIPTTFFASASAIAHVGATPVFCDIDPETRNFDMDKLRASVTSRTKAIIPVHLYGQPVDMSSLMPLAKEKGLLVIEDACQAQGGKWAGKKAGSFGNAACFSFYPGKNLGAYGDAGGIATDDDQVAATLRMLRDHGMPRKYEHELLGYNSRLDTLQAAVLDEKLSRLDEWNGLRAKAADLYLSLLNDTPDVITYPQIEGSLAVWHLFVIRVTDEALARGKTRDALARYLNEQGIGTNIHYPYPLHLVPAFSHLGYRQGDFPEAERFAAAILSLPIYPGITDEQIRYVADHVQRFFA